MAVRLKVATGEMYFNPHMISRVHLSPDHSMVTVHFVNGTVFSTPVESAEQRQIVGEFLAELSKPGSGFLSNGRELLNLSSALWVSIPDDGPTQVRWQDNRTHSLSDIEGDRVRSTLGGGPIGHVRAGTRTACPGSLRPAGALLEFRL